MTRMAFFAISNNIIVMSVSHATLITGDCSRPLQRASRHDRRVHLFHEHRRDLLLRAALHAMAALYVRCPSPLTWRSDRGCTAMQHTRWSLKSIAWLMVQIWFGNTLLSMFLK
jgi:hypothetical protein